MLRWLHNCLTFIRDRRGTAMIEFALVGPIVIALTIGIIDVGRLVWSASVINHLASETTRYASVRGAGSLVPATQSELETFIADRLIAMDPSDLTVVVSWSPSTPPGLPGGTIRVQLDYQFTFLLGGLAGLDPITLEGDSEMVVL